MFGYPISPANGWCSTSIRKTTHPGARPRACEFTAGITQLRKLGAVVLGCSPDDPERHRGFIKKHKLRVTLLSDPTHAVMEKYGAWGEKKLYGKTTIGVIRSTVIIDPTGTVVHHWRRVKAAGHAAKVIEKLRVLDSYSYKWKRFTKLHVVLLALALMTACAEEVAVPLPPSPAGMDVFLRPDTRVIEEVVPRRATLAGLVSEHGLDGRIAARLIDAVRPVFDPRRIRVGNSYRLVLADDGSLRRFEYHVDNDRFLRVRSRRDAGASFDAELVPYVKERVEIALQGGIDEERSSLVAALDGAGENVSLAIMMAKVFSGEIDFNNDLRRGDRFEVLFEKYFREEEFAGYGGVVAAEFDNDGRQVQAFRFQIPGDDEALYYDQEGRSVRRLFLRAPFRFEPRVTSRFSYRRLHPVLGTHRPHLGVDYGAPTGTPVIAVANGMVVSAARSGGSGNIVRLRHTNGYETYYLHLSSFATGVRKGARVVQGQLIGRVGSTGLATGPHLDFRMRKNSTFVNPLLEHRNLPPGDPVPDEHLAAFREVRDQALRRMRSSASPADITGVLTQ